MFVVEMWGLPRVADKEGILRPVRWFECHDKFWLGSLKLGQDNGWKPMGTIPSDGDSLENYIKRGSYNSGYEPYQYGESKMVLKDDAFQWAQALEKAIATGKIEKCPENENWLLLCNDDMDMDTLIDANRKLSVDRIREFIEFLKKGGFGFAWDD